ncbi:hypothetical protein E2562_002341 [Oryza meyeriana var. granulata]|uniref:Uncharacterized protein n=1 Tax=Oryza meyeriana var. granulata TaxID=110450 RepID=A0A6G1BIR3_9ORYZ|nr:hypothetical protein E2562_002341 [Oryza meyeriana var. granulata]
MAPPCLGRARFAGPCHAVVRGIRARPSAPSDRWPHAAWGLLGEGSLSETPPHTSTRCWEARSNVVALVDLSPRWREQPWSNTAASIDWWPPRQDHVFSGLHHRKLRFTALAPLVGAELA